MDGERIIHMTEEVPLNSGTANIFLNAGKSKDAKMNSHSGSTVVHLKTVKPSDLGVHINTTFSVASSKKINLMFIINILLSVICMVLSCSIAYYYWNEMVAMKKELELMKDNFLIHKLEENKAVSSHLVAPEPRNVATREPRMEKRVPGDDTENARKYFVEDLGDDMLLVDSKKKNGSKITAPHNSLMQKELRIAHFNGAINEINLGENPYIGPWRRDLTVSSDNSEKEIEMKANYFNIKEGGLYFIYAQIVYLTQSPNCYYLWARLTGESPRLLSTCSTGDDSSNRPLSKSQISCSMQTVARLYDGDTVNLAQRERNRTLWLKPGYSYFGFIKLNY